MLARLKSSLLLRRTELAVIVALLGAAAMNLALANGAMASAPAPAAHHFVLQ